MALSPDLHLRNFTLIYTFAGYGCAALVFCFFPFAGFLADVKYGRYKMVVGSLYLFLPSVPLIAVSIGVCCFALQDGIFCFFHYYNNCEDYTPILLGVLILAQ